MSEIANGYSWYKFDIDGWLNSADVQQMDFHERGVYHHLLTIQARDGKLAADTLALAKQAGVDRRTVQNWLKTWGFLLPIIALQNDTLVTPPQRECSAHATSTQLTCSVCAPKPLPLRCFPAASWMRTGSVRVNPKLWNLSVKSGKFDGQPIIEESRGEGYTEGESDLDQSGVKLTLRSLVPAAKGQGV
jgi:hypothetical protein